MLTVSIVGLSNTNIICRKNSSGNNKIVYTVKQSYMVTVYHFLEAVCMRKRVAVLLQVPCIYQQKQYNTCNNTVNTK